MGERAPSWGDVRYRWNEVAVDAVALGSLWIEANQDLGFNPDTDNDLSRATGRF